MTTTDFETESGDVILRGAREGSGTPIVLAHGLTAHRDLVVHGSRALARAGHELIRPDARGHGESDPGPVGSYVYEQLADDLDAVVAATGIERPFLAGHSMGAHTIAALALRDPSRWAGLVLIGPASVGVPLTDESLANWDRLADGLDDDGIDGFIAAYEAGMDPDWHDTLVRIARDRLSRHRDLGAVATAIREVPRSIPFDGLTELEALDVPTLVVASRDEADPGHPMSVAEAWAEAIPGARMISEGEGESPLAWQGESSPGRSPRSALPPERSGTGMPVIGAPYPLGTMSDDLGSPIHYTSVQRGTAVYDSEGAKVGEIRRVEDNYREHILDGFEITDNDGTVRFVDAPEVARTFERGVTLSVTAEQLPELAKPVDRGIGSIGTAPKGTGGGFLGRLFGR